VHDEKGFDAVAAVVGQALPQFARIHAAPPRSGDHFDVESEPARDLRPVLRKLADVERQHRVAGRERIHERRLPRAAS